jgi:hypothetical protein
MSYTTFRDWYVNVRPQRFCAVCSWDMPHPRTDTPAYWECCDKTCTSWAKCPSCNQLVQRIFLPEEIELERMPEDKATVIHKDPDYYFTEFNVLQPLPGFDLQKLHEQVIEKYHKLEVINQKNYWKDTDLKRTIIGDRFKDVIYTKEPTVKTVVPTYIPEGEEKAFKKRLSF